MHASDQKMEAGKVRTNEARLCGYLSFFTRCSLIPAPFLMASGHETRSSKNVKSNNCKSNSQLAFGMNTNVRITAVDVEIPSA